MQPFRKMSREDVALSAMLHGDEEVWPAVVGTKGVRSRDIFTYALALYEMGEKQERLGPLLDAAQKLQLKNRDGTWNFKWHSDQQGIKDHNAVEFCMRGAVLLWLRHGQAMSTQDRQVLETMMRRSAETCRRRDIPEKYTNIALMNAMNLILLGEVLSLPKAAEAGYKRLDQFCMYTWQWGIHEFASPTYTGVQLYCLAFIAQYSNNERAQVQAQGLLEVFLLQVAVNRGSASDPMMGTNSRKLKYFSTLFLSDDNSLDHVLQVLGWAPIQTVAATLHMRVLYAALAFEAYGNTEFSQALIKKTRQYPRWVQSSWGPDVQHTRAHWICPDVTLSCTGAGYNYPSGSDMPLTVDFPKPKVDDTLPYYRAIAFHSRAYFVAQFNDNPYGEKGAHHFAPFFWAGVQHKKDALGVALYNTKSHGKLNSYFIIPGEGEAKAVWIGDRQVYPQADHPIPAPEPFELDDILVCRVGRALVAAKVIWLQGLGEQPPTAKLAFDGEGIRLVMTHSADVITQEAGVAIWVRVGSDVENVARWIDAFKSAKVKTFEHDCHSGRTNRLKLEVEGDEQNLCVDTIRDMGDFFVTHTNPAPSAAILDVDGRLIAGSVLEKVEPVASHIKARMQLSPTDVSQEPTYVTADQGYVAAPMKLDASAEKTSFARVSMDYRDKMNDVGSITWRLQVSNAGAYFLWGLVQTLAKFEPSFLIRVFQESHEKPIYQGAWFTGVAISENWCPVRRHSQEQPQVLNLPTGDVFVQIFARQYGAQIRQLCIAVDPDFKPKV